MSFKRPHSRLKNSKTTFHDRITVIFGKLQNYFTSPQERILRNGYRLCENIKYTYFFVFAHSDVISQTQSGTSEGEAFPLYHAQVTILVNQSTICSEFSSTLLVPFAVLGTPTKGYQKSGTVQFAILVPFTTSDF